MVQKDKATLETGDFTGNTLVEGDYTIVAKREGGKKKFYKFGQPIDVNGGNFYLDLSDGTQAIEGTVRFTVYETDALDEIKVDKHGRAISNTYDLATLRASNRNNLQTWHALRPLIHGASDGEVVAMEVKTNNSTNAGNSVDESATDYTVPMLQVRP